MKQLSVLLLFFSCVLQANAQAKLVLNGAGIYMQNGSYLVIENNNPDAFIPLQTTTGITTDRTSFIRWHIGTASGSYTVPYYFSNRFIPFSFSTSAAIGAGFLDLNTYNVPTWKNSDYLPPGVMDMNMGGTDNSSKVIDRFWSVAAIGYSTKPTLSNVTFGYRDEEWAATGNVISEALLKAMRWNSTANTWTDYPPTGTANTTTNTVVVGSIAPANLFQWWTLAEAAAAPLPVTLLQFTATVKGNKKVETVWITTSETNTAYFVVERSQNAINFLPTDTVIAAGNSMVHNRYTAQDNEPFTGKSFYRLKMVDNDGSFKYSGIVPVTIIKTEGILVYPNPVSKHLFIAIERNGVGGMILINEKGQTVVVKKALQGQNTIDMGNMPAGIYWLKIIFDNKTEQFKIIKQ